VGGLVGLTEGIIRNAGVDGGTLSGLQRAGGLVGQSGPGTLQRLFSRNVTVTQRDGGSCCMGGLIGGNENSATFSDAYSRSNLVHTSAGQGAFGGITGNTNSSGAFARGYTTGTFTTLATRPSQVGAIQGASQVLITNGFWDTETSTGFNSSPSGTGLTTAQMKDSSNYTGWDFTTVWAINSAINDGYPYLQWEDNRIDAPVLVTVNPSNNAVDVSVDSNVIITFNIPVGAESGTITFYNASDDSVFETIDVAGGPISGSGTTALTINPINNFEEGATYYVLIDETAIRSIAGINFAGISSSTALVFTTEDSTAPAVVSLSPQHNDTGVVFNPTLSIVFDEDVLFDNGSIAVYRSGDDTEIVSIPLSGGSPNSTISVEFIEKLEESTQYYVLVSDDAIVDTAGNNFAGILDTSAWVFTTRNAGDPVLSHPSNNSAISNEVTVEYELTEAPLAGSIQLQFAGDTTITLNLEDVSVGELR